MSMTEDSNQVDVSREELPEPARSGTAAAEGIARQVLSRLGITGWELSIHFCMDNTIRKLNREYRNQDRATDILSFSQTEDAFPPAPAEAGRQVAGDLVISVETLQRNAAQDKISFATELKRLIIHGILHLGGRDHTAGDHAMLDLQEEILKNITQGEDG